MARCTIELLYRANGWEGARYGKKPRTTISEERAARAADLVNRLRPAGSEPAVGRGLHLASRPGWGMVYVALSSSTRSPAV